MGFEPHEFERTSQSPRYYWFIGFWWAARVSIPAPWEYFQSVQDCRSPSRFGGQPKLYMRQHRPLSFKI